MKESLEFPYWQSCVKLQGCVKLGIVSIRPLWDMTSETWEKFYTCILDTLFPILYHTCELPGLAAGCELAIVNDPVTSLHPTPSHHAR